MSIEDSSQPIWRYQHVMCAKEIDRLQTRINKLEESKTTKAALDNCKEMYAELRAYKEKIDLERWFYRQIAIGYCDMRPDEAIKFVDAYAEALIKEQREKK